MHHDVADICFGGWSVGQMVLDSWCEIAILTNFWKPFCEHEMDFRVADTAIDSLPNLLTRFEPILRAQ
jgi:hypothetical protein